MPTSKEQLQSMKQLILELQTHELDPSLQGYHLREARLVTNNLTKKQDSNHLSKVTNRARLEHPGNHHMRIR